MPEISIQAADGSKRRVPLDKERTTIGRSRESDIFLPDQWLSRHHAEIRQRPDGFYLADLGSKNGTLLNNEKIAAERRLRQGDVITLGEHLLTFAAEEAADDDDFEPAGTQLFSARELSSVATKPVADPKDLVRQNRILTILTRSTGELLLHKPLDQLFHLILKLLFDAVPAERGAILLLEGTPPQPVIKASLSRQGQPISRVSRSIARKCLAEQKCVLLPNLMEDAAFKAQDSILSSGIRSAVCAPLWFTSGEAGKDDVIGLVYLDSLQRSHTFDEDDLAIVTALANVAAAKIENVRLLEESLEKRRLEEEMRVAAEIQRSLLPKEAPTLDGWGLFGSNRPCRTIGGDYYDFAIDHNRLLLALGDVSGKGTGAALLMTVLRAAVRAHWLERSTSEAVCRINRTVCENVPSGKFVTFFMAQLDPQSGHLTYVNAGHNPPLLVRGSQVAETLGEGGMVLGLLDSVPYAEGSIQMQSGDVLLIYSDGVTETWNPKDEEFGEDGLVAVATRCSHLSAAGIEAEILKQLDTFAEGAKATDDRTLIVLKRA